jgi:hypothetical protein
MTMSYCFVMMSLCRLPDGLAGNITSWRCFIGRGGRARLERIDHVTHESLNAIKQEQSAVQQHYAVGCRSGGGLPLLTYSLEGSLLCMKP